MEFESMDNCFRTAQGDSKTTCNGPSTRGPMAPIWSDQEPFGSSPRSTPTASTAATTVPFQWPRFDITYGRFGRLLRTLLNTSSALPIVAGTAGAIAWSGHVATVPLSLIAPVLVYHAKSRVHAYTLMFTYYAAASWPIVPGVRAFFGPKGTPLIGLILCVGAAALLALPWGLLFTSRRRRAAVFLPTCVLIAAVPPLGIIGWASPLLSAGVLFPGSKWLGLALIIIFLMVFPFRRTASAVGLALCAILFQFHYTQPRVPAGWEAVNTTFGGAGQGEPDFETEYNTHQSIQTTIRESRAAVLLFPEHLVTHWNDSTDAFWQDKLAHLAAEHRTVLIGAGINPPDVTGRPFGSNRYLNVLLARGEENTALYQQRVPVPIAMWKPFGEGGVPARVFGRGTIRIREQNAAVLVCYEQLLVWPFVSSALEHPTVLLTTSNDYWAKGTQIPAIQQSSAASWARLFRLPILSATNF